MLKPVVKVLSQYMIFPVITSVIGFFLLPLKSQYLTPTDYGILGLLESLVMLLGICISLQINSGVVRLYFDVKDKEKREYLGSIFVFFLISEVVVTLAFGVFLYFFSGKVFQSGELTFFPFIAVQLLTIFIVQFSRVPDLHFHVHQQVRFTGALNLLTFLLTNGFTLLFIIVFKLGALGVLLAGLLNSALLLPFYLYVTFRHTKPSFNRRYIGKTLLYSLPFIPATLGTLLGSYNDRYIIQYNMKLEDAGIYTFAFLLVIPFNFLMSAMEYAYTPNYYKHRTQRIGQASLRRTIDVLSVLLGLFCVGWVFFLSEIKFLFNAQYTLSFLLFSFLSVSSFLKLLYYFPSVVLLYHKKTIFVPLLTILPALANIGLNLLLIPRFGLAGAVAGNLGCALLTLVLAHVFAFLIERDNFNFLKIALLIIAVGALCSLEVVLGGLPFWLSIPSKLGLLVGYVLGCAFLFRISLPELWKKLLTLVALRLKGRPATKPASPFASNRNASQAETDTILRTE